MLTAIVHAGSKVLELLADSAFRSLLLACVVAVVLGVFRMRAVRAKLAVWRGVLLVALAMPLLLWLAPAVPLPVPLPSFSRANAAFALEFSPAGTTPAFAASQFSATQQPRGKASRESLAPLARIAAPQAPLLGFSLPNPVWTFSWPFAALCLYLAVAWILAARVLIGTYFGGRLRHGSRQIEDANALQSLRLAARACRLRSVPELAESNLLIVPLTLGIVRPAVLLPSSWNNWDSDELTAVLAHEVSHVARRDALVQLLALFHRVVFWFNPLSWWLEQHLADLGEQASDEAALAGGADRTRYAQILIGFLAQLETSPARVCWRSLAMAKLGQGERRVDRILAWRSSMKTRISGPLVAAMVAICALAVAVSVTAHPVPYSPQYMQAPPVPDPPQPPQQLAPRPYAVPVSPSTQIAHPADPPTPPQAAVKAPEQPLPSQAPQPPAVPPTPPVPAAPAVPPAPPIPPEPAAPAAPMGIPPELNVQLHLNLMNGPFGPWGLRFVIVTQGSDNLIISGSEEDAEHARALRSKIPGDFIWFEIDGRSYIIQDRATVDRAKQIWAQRGNSAQQQQQLEAKEQELAKEMREQVQQRIQEIRVKIPDMTAELQKLQSEVKELNAEGATIQQLGDLQSQVGQLQQALGEARWNSNLQEINRNSRELGRQMSELGRQIGQLARQGVAQWRQASEQMRQLLDNAVAGGTAKPE